MTSLDFSKEIESCFLHLVRRQVESTVLISLFPENHLKNKYRSNSTIAYIEHFRLVNFLESPAKVTLFRLSTDNLV